jgi:hypothetical protein
VLGHQGQVLGSFLIVAVSMRHPFVAEIIPASKGCRNTVVNFQEVFIAKGEATSWALSLLQSEEVRFLASHQRVLFQSLRPVDKVPIIRTRLPSNFHVGLVERVYMLADRERFPVPFDVLAMSPTSETSMHLDGLPFSEPVFALPGVPCLFPASQLFEGEVLTVAEQP